MANLANLNEDILYLIFEQVFLDEAITLRAQREELFSFSLVCHRWSSAAQSLLFRHVVLHMRRPMLAFLDAITHKTIRGRTLASYVKSLTVKLSRETEIRDPPPLPMIHTRHVIGLLAHLPSLVELDITLGVQPFNVQQLDFLTKYSNLRKLTITTKLPIEDMFQHTRTGQLWKNVKSLSLPDGPKKWSPYDPVPTDPLGLPPPPLFSLIHCEIGSEKNSMDGWTPGKVAWLLSNSRKTLRYLSVYGAVKFHPEPYIGAFTSNLVSLTLARVSWDRSFIDMLQSEDVNRNLLELRLVDSILLNHSFPSANAFPRALQHLTLALPPSIEESPQTWDLTFHIPLQLRTLMVKEVGWITPHINTGNWMRKYVADCEHMNIEVTQIPVERAYTKPAAGLPPARLQPPPIGRMGLVYEPTESELDLTDFKTVFNDKSNNVIEPLGKSHYDRSTSYSATTSMTSKPSKRIWLSSLFYGSSGEHQ